MMPVRRSGQLELLVLEGLHGAWLGSQPGADAGLAPRRIAATAAVVTLRYGRA